MTGDWNQILGTSFEFGVELKHENRCPRFGRILHEMKRLLVFVGGDTSSLAKKPQGRTSTQ